MRETLSAEGIRSAQGDGESLEWCSAMLYPARGQPGVVKITGVYVPPPQTSGLTGSDLRQLLLPEITGDMQERSGDLDIGMRICEVIVRESAPRV